MTHVLVVEDDPALRRSLTLNLTGARLHGRRDGQR